MPQTEDLGISFVHQIIARMGYFFREQSKHDFGIDAHVETADETAKGTGRNLALQIKSGESYIKYDKSGHIIFSTDERHIKYWAEHSLPVILIIYSPSQNQAWWCDVKQYISRNPSLMNNAAAIKIPVSQILTHTNNKDFARIANTPSYPLSSNRQYYTLIKPYDISMQAKSYKAEILVDRFANQDIVRFAIFQATTDLKRIVEHRSPTLERRWGNQSPHLITLFVYKDLDDLSHANWVAKSVWRDPNNEPAKQMHFGEVNDHINDIEVYFASEEKYWSWKQFLESRIITKTEFHKKIARWLPKVDNLIEKAKLIVKQFEASELDASTYQAMMSKLSEEYTSIEREYSEGTTASTECRDAEIRFIATVGSGGNVLIFFTNHGLKTWTDSKARQYMIKRYLSRYDADRKRLDFEIDKLRQ